MRHAVLSTFLFVAILGMGCMGVAVPGKTEELKHPIELGAKCKAHYERFLAWDQYYKNFGYAYDAKGSYACGTSSRSPVGSGTLDLPLILSTRSVGPMALSHGTGD